MAWGTCGINEHRKEKVWYVSAHPKNHGQVLRLCPNSTLIVSFVPRSWNRVLGFSVYPNDQRNNF